ncbi:MAG: ornithine cyclodeaminase family protein [Deltaproteobacteria bacterium]|nr:ornithine cyclodeaminase family protein [Deltaproteobacteria bacterium]
MKPIEMIYLSETDIVAMGVGMVEVIVLVERGLSEHGKGQVENPPKPGIHATPNSFIHAMPAYFKNLGIGGIKWVSGYPDNRDIGLPQIIGTIILNDMKTGVPVCIMDGTWITAVRTAAVSAVTAKYCARKDSKVLGIVGTGVQGRQNLIALKTQLPGISRVKVFDINQTAALRCREELSSQIEVEIMVCDSVEEVARGSDIILTATQRLAKPLVKDEWFGEGCLGMGLEASRAWHGNAILNTDKFITDDWEQTKHFKSQGAFPDGLPKLYAELGSIVAGKKPGRETEGERILAINIGLALSDLIVAHHVYEIAKKKNTYPKLRLN